jgi:hypothetical protein
MLRASMRLLLAAAVFLSAALLFWVEPLATKLCLPLLGGGPSVWNTSLVFFQGMLLGGYLYAHATSRLLSPRPQALLHVGLLAAAFLALPVAIRTDDVPPAGGSPVLWMFGWLLLRVGAPFLLLAATAPLLQHWLARSAARGADDPYPLYAASNAGSLLGLLAFPTLLEPRLTLAQQSVTWSAGYAAAALLIAAAALAALAQAPGRTAMRLARSRSTGSPAPLGRRLRWMLLAFAPSSLLLGVTTQLTTDVAAVPLLWVVPLALYLLSFVLTFHRPALPPGLALWLQPLLLVPLAFSFLWPVSTVLAPALFFHLAAFFVTALVCHGELARTRPPAAQLTGYFLTIAFGGVLGGMLNALVAPALFRDLVEYPALIALAAALRPPAPAGSGAAWLDLGWPLLLLAIMAAPPFLFHEAYGGLAESALVYAVLPVALIVYSFRRRPIRFALGLAAILVVIALDPPSHPVLLRQRNFFGVLEVATNKDPPMHLLYHGTTEHGKQRLEPELRLVPQSYYAAEGPLGDVFAALRARNAPLSVGAIGLGAGEVACYGRASEIWTFYEIDPAVIAIAGDRRYFTYLADCPPRSHIVIGDGRLSIARADAASFDLIVLDAFSSDAIPVHLLTRQAFALYREKLRPRGLIAVNITNRYLDLRPVLGNLAAASGLAASSREDPGEDPDDEASRNGSQWVVLASRSADLGAIADNENWRPLPGDPSVGLWTDDYSNLLATLHPWSATP